MCGPWYLVRSWHLTVLYLPGEETEAQTGEAAWSGSQGRAQQLGAQRPARCPPEAPFDLYGHRGVLSGRRFRFPFLSKETSHSDWSSVLQFSVVNIPASPPPLLHHSLSTVCWRLRGWGGGGRSSAPRPRGILRDQCPVRGACGLWAQRNSASTSALFLSEVFSREAHGPVVTKGEPESSPVESKSQYFFHWGRTT